MLIDFFNDITRKELWLLLMVAYFLTFHLHGSALAFGICNCIGSIIFLLKNVDAFGNVLPLLKLKVFELFLVFKVPCVH